VNKAFLAAVFLTLGITLNGQDADAKQRARQVRDEAKRGEDGIAAIAPLIADADVGVRVEATKALVTIGGPKTLDPLLRATGDNDPEVQIRATDGLVNVYLPGYVKSGLSGTLSRAGTSIRSKFTDTNDQVIDPYLQVRPDVITVLGKLARGGASMDARANAARGLGVLRGRAAIPELVEALRSKDDKLMYESLVAIGKIGDTSAAPRITFLLRDLDEKVQTQALEVTGLLRNKEAAPQVRDVYRVARTPKVRRAALEALAMLADPADHAVFISALGEKDEGVRAAAAEGLGRIKFAQDRMVLEPVFTTERAMEPRLSLAFALVSLGDISAERYGPLRYLFNTLNQRAYRGIASAFLIELTRSDVIRQAVYPMLADASKDEKIQFCGVLAQSGQNDSINFLQMLSKDSDPDVAAEGIRSLRVLRARVRQ
jgi:HEAT repeat protein